MNAVLMTRQSRILNVVAALLVAAVAVVFNLATISPVNAAEQRVVKDVLWQGGPACTGSKRYTIISEAQGTVSHRWIFGPPHLGYKWKGGVAGKHVTMAYDTTETNGRDVYDAQVVATSYNGRAPKIERAYGVCR